MSIESEVLKKINFSDIINEIVEKKTRKKTF